MTDHDNAVSPALIDALMLLGDLIPEHIEGYLCDRVDQGGMTDSQWMELVDLRLAEICHCDGVAIPELTGLGELLQLECRARREDRDASN